MKISLIALFLVAFMLALAVGCSSGQTHKALAGASPGLEDAVDGFTLKIWDESFPSADQTGIFDLEVIETATQRIVNISATGLVELDSLYLSIGYDHRRFHAIDVSFTNSLGKPNDCLQLHQLHHPGELHVGQVLIHPAENPGLSGDADLMQIVFESGAQTPMATGRIISAAQNGGAAVVWLRDYEAEVQWTFGGIGDYDQNGEVNLTDLTPIAVNYGTAGRFDPLSLEYVVDGDGNGEINLADITPIVLHYGEVTEGYDIYLRRPSEFTETARHTSFATDPLLSLTKDDRVDVDGVQRLGFDPMEFSGQIYDEQLVSIAIADGIYSVMLGNEHALIEVAPITTEPGDRPSVYLGGDPEGMPRLEWETAVIGTGTFADPFKVDLDTANSFRLTDDSAQDVSSSYRFNTLLKPTDPSLYDSVIFGKVNNTSGDWPWELVVDDGTELAHEIPTRMVLSFAPVTPGDGIATNVWVAYDLKNSAPDYWIVDFSISPNPAPANWPIRLDASPSSLPESETQNYSWVVEELGVDDLTAKSEFNASDPLAVAWLSFEGEHNVRLSITVNPDTPESFSLIPFDRSSQIIEAPFGSEPPIAVANATPALVEPGQQSVLLGTDSSHAQFALGFRVVDYYWELTGQGAVGTATIDEPYSEVSSVAFSEDAQGTFTFTLHVLDNIGTSAIDTVEVVVETVDRRPVASFSSNPNPVIVNNQVTFDASTSYHEDPLLSIVEYRWDFDGDGTDDLTESDPIAVHTYTEVGNQQVRLTVMDDADPPVSDPVFRSVVVNPVPNDPPLANLVAETSPSRVNRVVTLDASGSTDSDGTIVRYEFDVDGDNNYEYDGTESIVEHTYLTPFNLWATVRVTDNDGAVRMTSTAMHILPEASWHISTIDDGEGTNDVGRNAHLALVDGFPAVAYYDSTAQDLKFIRAQNSIGSGSWRDGIVVAATPGVDDGHYPVLFQVGSNPPVIGFHDATNGKLDFVPALDSAGLAWDVPISIDGALTNTGQGLSGITNSTTTSLAYYDTSVNKLMFIQATNEAGTTWGAPVEVAQAAGAIDPASDTSMSFNVGGFPCITTQFDGGATLHVATAADGSTWNPKVVIQSLAGSSASTGFLPPSAYGVYFDPGAGEARFELASQADGSSWGETPSTIGSLADAGEIAMLGPGDTQNLLYEYYLEYFVCIGSPTAGLVAFTTEILEGTSWSAAETIDPGVGAGANGLSMLVTTQRPAIAWWDQDNGHLKYAYYD